jgi:hypothetical protein
MYIRDSPVRSRILPFSSVSTSLLLSSVLTGGSGADEVRAPEIVMPRPPAARPTRMGGGRRSRGHGRDYAAVVCSMAGMEEVLRNGADMTSTTLIWKGAAHRHLQGEWDVVRGALTTT